MATHPGNSDMISEVFGPPCQPWHLSGEFPEVSLELRAKTVLTVLCDDRFHVPEELSMDPKIADEVAALTLQTVGELRERYAQVFGEPTRAWHRDWLIKRIAWRLQALAEGDLSERARRRAVELANDADLRLSPLRAARRAETSRLPVPARRSDSRLPPPGHVLVRVYQGQRLEVRIMSRGFRFNGMTYPSLSAVAKAVTGSHCNGYHFFRLGKQGGVR
jgi:hypothetical protein